MLSPSFLTDVRCLGSICMYYFPIAVITICQRFNVLKQHRFIFLVMEVRSLKSVSQGRNQCVYRAISPPEILGETLFPFLTSGAAFLVSLVLWPLFHLQSQSYNISKSLLPSLLSLLSLYLCF